MVSLDVPFCRAAFPPLDNGVVYFENAGGSYVPKPVIERLTAYMVQNQNQPYWAFKSSQDATEQLELSQARMAEMIGAEIDEIVVGPSTTLNVFVLAQALRRYFEPGDEIIVTQQDHEANGGAWRRLYSLCFTICKTRTTIALSKPSAVISSTDMSFSMNASRIGSSTE